MGADRHADRWIKCISSKGNVRGVAIQATGLVSELCKLHQMTGFAAQSLGEAVIGAITLASYCKSQERINLNIQSSGLISQALVDAYPDGAVRGYASVRPDGGAIGDKGPWGEGLLSVLRAKNEPGEQPYIGTVPLITGHLAKDLTFYWMHSEQVPSAVGLAVKTRGDEVVAAGGFLVQAMPGATAEELKSIEEHIVEIGPLADQLHANPDPTVLLSQVFQDTTFLLVEEKPLFHRCNCSWERVKRAVALVGAEELRSMITQDEGAFVRCDFCTKDYRLDRAALEAMIQESAAKA